MSEVERKYAAVHWSRADAKSMAESYGIVLNEEQQDDLLQSCEEDINDRMLEAGWRVLIGAFKREYQIDFDD